MEIASSLAEIVATFVEASVILGMVFSVFSTTRIKGRNQVPFLVCVLIFTIFTTCMNAWSLFSFITPVGGILIATLLTGKVLDNSRFFLRATTSVMAMLVVQIIDYILIVGLGILKGNPRDIFSEYLMPGLPRMMYLLVDKSCDVAIFLVFHKHLHRLADLQNKLLGVLFVCASSLYVVMQYLLSTVIYGDFIQLQGAALISFFLLLCFIIVFAASLLAVTSSEKERTTNQILTTMNRMMETNYNLMNQRIKDNAKQLHDFHHHLTVISGLAQKESSENVSAYVHSLIENAVPAAQLCRSGSDIIDAVINSKAIEAQQKDVQFIYNIRIFDLRAFEPVDLCAVLSNQLENALESCEKLQSERKVSVELTQQEGFILLKVTNPVKENPFSVNGELHSTKTDDILTHGFGLNNIRDIARKYSGSLKNEYQDGKFVSTVLLCKPTGEYSSQRIQKYAITIRKRESGKRD